MRIAVLSDTHANLVALEAVLEQVDDLAPDALWCLGDTVGYGPEPQACADIMRERGDLCLAGNHDLAVAGKLSLDRFNDIARFAAEWQRERLRPETMAWLRELPCREQREDITMVHASPRSPVWEYVDGPLTAGANYTEFETPLCLVGHSHIAVGWEMYEEEGRVHVHWATQIMGQPLHFDLDHRWLFNPGSVGQPRDRDARASFALLDTKARTWTWHRVGYDTEFVEQAIAAAGLPIWLGRRLHVGN